jgi:hypothetical protein
MAGKDVSMLGSGTAEPVADRKLKLIVPDGFFACFYDAVVEMENSKVYQ